MLLSNALLLVLEGKEKNRQRFDILLTAMRLMDETENESSIADNKTVIDLTAGVDKLVAGFIDLTKAPEVFNLCSLSSSSSSTSSGLSKLMPHDLLQHTSMMNYSDDVNNSSESDISFNRTGGNDGLPHPQLIGTLIHFWWDKVPAVIQ